jgi:site-specific recombinase XerD
MSLINQHIACGVDIQLNLSEQKWVGLSERYSIAGSAYWLRHTFAQNLLERGASIYEIKEMLGQENIQSSEKYLRIHIKLMREVILNETI